MSGIAETMAYFQRGGTVMWPLLLCSVSVIAIAVERFLYYRTADSDGKFVRSYCEMLQRDGVEAATSFAAAASGRTAQIVAAAAKKSNRAMSEAYMENQASIFMATLRDKLDYLSIIVTLSPLLGLLGTIVGMIGAFSVFDLEAGAPLAITGGIGEALIATASGLCVAIMSLAAHSYFAHRMDNMITDMEICFSALLEAKTE